MKSNFDGGLLGLVAINIITFILTFLTFGLAYPWAVTMKLRWICSHTIIEGRRLKFIGTGISLVAKWIKWILLTIITFGIYSFWLVIKLKQWEVENTIFEN